MHLEMFWINLKWWSLLRPPAQNMGLHLRPQWFRPSKYLKVGPPDLGGARWKAGPFAPMGPAHSNDGLAISGPAPVRSRPVGWCSPAAVNGEMTTCLALPENCSLGYVQACNSLHHHVVTTTTTNCSEQALWLKIQLRIHTIASLLSLISRTPKC